MRDRHRHATGRAGDRGSGTVLTIALCAVLACAAAALGLLAAAAAARHRAASAADLAALAASDVALGRRAGDACELADQVASRNGAVLTGCATSGDGTAVVRVAVRPRVGAAALGSATVTARAGPAP